MTTVSVIIPTYNHARFIGDAIDSVLAQTLAPLEVIVVDDGSTDGTQEILRAYGAQVRVIRQENSSAAVARNTGIAAARGEFLAFLDSDDLWLPEKLERQVERARADPDAGFIACGLERIDEAGRRLSVTLEAGEGWVARDMLRFDRDIIVGGGSCALVPARVVREVGMFDPQLPPSEDWEFAYRVASRYRVAFVREVLVRYRIHQGGVHFNIPGMERAMLMALDKAFNAGGPAVPELRRHAFGRLHRILAGCYFEQRRFRPFARHVAASLRHDPGNAAYFLSFPVRRLMRAIKPPAATPET